MVNHNTQPAQSKAENWPIPAPLALDNIRLVEQLTYPACRSTFSEAMSAVNTFTGEAFDINCRSWRCEKHREKWGRKWGAIIGEQLEFKPATLLVNLTTAERISHVELEAALRHFIRDFRVAFGETEYIKVVEYNRKKTQPHFHLIFINPTLKIPKMPNNYAKAKSWPEDLWQAICLLWEESLAFAAPGKKKTTVTWCQPPMGKGQKAANYAIGYITGKSSKDEEPDSTWRGRKLSYSKKFFDRPARDIWADLLDKWFPEKEACHFHWRAKDTWLDERGPSPFAKMAIVRQREAEAWYYKKYGHLPGGQPAPLLVSVYFEMAESGQEYFSSG